MSSMWTTWGTKEAGDACCVCAGRHTLACTEDRTERECVVGRAGQDAKEGWAGSKGEGRHGHEPEELVTLRVVQPHWPALLAVRAEIVPRKYVHNWSSV